MAAPRKYTDEQRSAIHSLRQRGLSGSNIAAECRRGVAGLKPFSVPERSALHVADEVEREKVADARRANGPDLDAMVELAQEVPERMLGIVDRQLDFLEKAAGTAKLTLDNVRMMSELEKLRRAILKPLEKEQRQAPSQSGANGNTGGDDFLDRLDAQLREEEMEEKKTA